MIFKSKKSLNINKNINELNDFLKNKSAETIQCASLFGETSYIMTYDYDRFIISKEAIPFKRNGIVVINLILKIDEIDDINSKMDYTIKYSDLSNLIIVGIYILITSFTLFGSELRFFGSIITMTSFVTKFSLIIVETTFLTLFLWLGIKTSKRKFEEIIGSLITSLKEASR